MGDSRKHYIITRIILFFLSIPVIGTILYSLSSSWGATILPDGFTLKWFVALFTDLRFLASLQRSFAIGIVSLLVSMFVIILSIVISAYYFPKVLKVIEFISLLPFMVLLLFLQLGF